MVSGKASSETMASDNLVDLFLSFFAILHNTLNHVLDRSLPISLPGSIVKYVLAFYFQ